MGVLWLNGRLVDERSAVVSPLDRGLIWGDGLFETLRAYDGRPFAPARHHARLEDGSRALDLPVPTLDELTAAFAAVLEANGLRDAGVRVTVTRGAGPADPHAEPDGPPNVVVTAWPLRDYSALYESGARLVSGLRAGAPVPLVKTISYAANVAGRLQARRADVDDTLFVTPEGGVLETTGSNVMAVTGTTLATPPVELGLLPGVTRATVLGAAASAGLTTEERPVAFEELMAADEVVLTSSLREVYPAAEIDGRRLGRGGTAAALREAYRAAVFADTGVAG